MTLFYYVSCLMNIPAFGLELNFPNHASILTSQPWPDT